MPLFQPTDIILNGIIKIEKQIGAGAFGEVYLVTNLDQGVPQAIKVAHRAMPGFGSTRFEEAFGRFRQEADLGTRLSHPNLIKVFELVEDNQGLYLIMEYASGGNLADRLYELRQNNEKLPIDRVVDIMKQLSSGLAVLHNKLEPVVHRDLKPSNILFDKDGNPKIADFGLAQIPHGLSQRSRLGSIAMQHPGTPMYMSPEQENSLAILRPVSDVYSLGLIFFELLTGVNYKMQRPGTLVTSFRKEVPENISRLLTSMLAEDPNQRPWDGAEVLAALETLSARRVPPFDQTPMQPSSQPQTFQSETVKTATETMQPPVSTQKPAIQVPQPVAKSAEQTIPKKSKIWVWAGVIGAVFLCLAVVGIGSAMGSRLFNKSTPIPIKSAPIIEFLTSIPTNPVPAVVEETNTPVVIQNQPSDTSGGVQLTATVVAKLTQLARIPWQQGHLVYSQRSSSGAQMVYYDLETNQSVRTLNSGTSENYLLGASFSADGNWVAYYQYPDSLFKIATDGNGSAQSLGSCQSPSWGSSSELVCKGSGNKLMIFKNGSFSAIPGVFGLMGDLSPQGNEVVYAVSESGSLKIYKAGTNGGGKSLLAGEASENYAPSWSPDGQWIAYQSNQDSANSEIWIMDANGGQKQRLTFSPAGSWSRGPAWSPDGEWLAFVSSKEQSIGADFGEIYVISLESGELVRITNTGGQVYDWRIDWGR